MFLLDDILTGDIDMAHELMFICLGPPTHSKTHAMRT